MATPQKRVFWGIGGWVSRFSSPFDRFSFAPGASAFTQLKTIVLPGELILCKAQGTGYSRLREVCGAPPLRRKEGARMGHPESVFHGALRQRGGRNHSNYTAIRERSPRLAVPRRKHSARPGPSARSSQKPR